MICVANVGNDTAAEVEGEAAQVADNFGRVGILDGFHRLKALAEGANLCGWVVEECHERLQL